MKGGVLARSPEWLVVVDGRVGYIGVLWFRATVRPTASGSDPNRIPRCGSKQRTKNQQQKGTRNKDKTGMARPSERLCRSKRQDLWTRFVSLYSCQSVYPSQRRAAWWGKVIARRDRVRLQSSLECFQEKEQFFNHVVRGMDYITVPSSDPRKIVIRCGRASLRRCAILT